MKGHSLHLLVIVAFEVAGCAAIDVAPAPGLVNPSFESGWEGWTATDANRTGAALSDVAYDGATSVKLTAKNAFVSQVVPVRKQTIYQLTAQVRGVGNVGVKVGPDLFVDQNVDPGRRWNEVSVIFETGDLARVSIFGSYAGGEARFDDFRLFLVKNGAVEPSVRIKSPTAGGYGLSPDLPPGRNFDLLDWYLNTPADDNNDSKSDRTSETDLAQGAVDPRYFYTGSDGGMVFKATIGGARTSSNTKFTRTELREMLRRGNTSIRTKNDDGTPNKNNWVFSSAPQAAQSSAGGVNGTLRATLAVNHVTTTGASNQVGRVIVGQIHAKDDEPVRLYYRKLPGHERGSLYFAHEPSGEDDVYVELIGSRSDSASDPVDGIALDEHFSYEIEAQGNLLTVRIFKGESVCAQKTYDMSASGYDVANDFMYFKAGVYNQNNSGDPDDYVQATFYELENHHEGYGDGT